MKMKSKYYAVKIGRNPGIYTSWIECEKQVKYYPHAAFKSFKYESEAKQYLTGVISQQTLEHYWEC
jgi:ribonuclease HI